MKYKHLKTQVFGVFFVYIINTKEGKMITITYEELFDYDKLYRGHLRGRLSKRDKKPLVRFEMNMLDNLSFLHDRIKDGNTSQVNTALLQLEFQSSVRYKLSLMITELFNTYCATMYLLRILQIVL